MNFRTIIINLERENVKKAKMISLMDKLHISDYEILKAVDGKKVAFNRDKTGVIWNNVNYKYSKYSGDLIFRKRYLDAREIGCSLSHHMAVNNQQQDILTLILEDDAVFISDEKKWNEYLDNIPPPDDYDIIFFSDCTWLSAPYKQEGKFNNYYSFLPNNYYNYSGTHAYLINPRILPILNQNYSLTLAADDYLSYCINVFNLKALVSQEVLFTQNPSKYLL